MSNISFNPIAWAIRPLYERAKKEDELFAKEVAEKESRTENPKSLDECAEYILGEAFKWAEEHCNGNVAFSGLPDDEVINLIKHYYDEDNLEIKEVKVGYSFGGGVEEKADESVSIPRPIKKPKVVKPERPKDTLESTHIPMVRPESAREARRESKKQAESVKVYDLFAGLDADDDEEAKVAVEEDDLPM